MCLGTLSGRRRLILGSGQSRWLWAMPHWPCRSHSALDSAAGSDSWPCTLRPRCAYSSSVLFWCQGLFSKLCARWDVVVVQGEAGKGLSSCEQFAVPAVTNNKPLRVCASLSSLLSIGAASLGVQGVLPPVRNSVQVWNQTRQFSVIRLAPYPVRPGRSRYTGSSTCPLPGFHCQGDSSVPLSVPAVLKRPAALGKECRELPESENRLRLFLSASHCLFRGAKACTSASGSGHWCLRAVAFTGAAPCLLLDRLSQVEIVPGVNM